MKHPELSVIIPAYNEEQFLPKLLDSLGAQTFPSFEVIVVDGGSSDGTRAACRAYEKKVPNLQVKTTTKGASFQRNAGAKLATAPWLVFLDADSILFPFALEKIFSRVRGYSNGVGTGWFTSDDNWFVNMGALFLGNFLFELNRIFRCPLAPGAFTIVSRKEFIGLGGYNEDISFAEDQEFTIRAVNSGMPFIMIRKVLFRYSARRFRKYGFLTTAGMYLHSGIAFLFTGRAPAQTQQFVSGGHIYRQRKKL